MVGRETLEQLLVERVLWVGPGSGSVRGPCGGSKLVLGRRTWTHFGGQYSADRSIEGVVDMAGRCKSRAGVSALRVVHGGARVCLHRCAGMRDACMWYCN